jgi:hypothetical protein
VHALTADGASFGNSSYPTSAATFEKGPVSQRPPVLPFQSRDQPGHIFPHPGARLGTGEPARNPLVQLVQPGRDKLHHHALNDPPRIS